MCWVPRAVAVSVMHEGVSDARCALKVTCICANLSVKHYMHLLIVCEIVIRIQDFMEY